MRSRAVLVLLVVLAGCAGTPDLGATDAPSTAATTAAPATPTPTPVATTTAASPTTAASSTTATATAARDTATTTTPTGGETLAPGVTTAGVRNVTALVDAHLAALNATGWRHRVEYRTAVGFAGRNATLEATRTKRATVTAGMARYRLVRTDDETTRTRTGERAGSQHRDAWSNGTVALVRLETDNRTVYRTGKEYGPDGRAERESRLTDHLFLREYLAMGEYAVAGTNRTGDGERITLVADGVADGAGNVSRFDATAVVDDRGRIHRFAVVMAGTENGRQLAVRGRYRLVGTGVEAPDEPEWLDAALAATNATA